MSLTAGCIDGADPTGQSDLGSEDPVEPTPTVGVPTPANGSTPAPTLTPFRFDADAPVQRVHWSNGSFAPEQTGIGGGFVTGTFVQQIDLSAYVPAEVPVRLRVAVTLDAEEAVVVGPTARADPVGNGTVWYEGQWRQTAPGNYALDAVVKRAADGTFGVALEAYTPGPDDPSQVVYTVRLEVSADPEWVPAGVPVAVSLDANETVRFESAGSDPVELLVHGPDDRLVERLYFVGSVEWRVPASASGVYVIVPIQGADGVRLLGHASDEESAGSLRPLALARSTGTPYEVAPLQTTAWSFDADTRPLRILLTVLGPAGGPWVCAGSLEVHLAAPEGKLLGQTADCPSPTNVPFLYEEERTWATDLGDARVVAGTYEVAIDNTLWQGHMAYHTIETYAR